MPNVAINDNVIIGAGSIVTRDVEAHSVVAGCPARKIMDLETYKNKVLIDQVHNKNRLKADQKVKFCEL